MPVIGTHSLYKFTDFQVRGIDQFLNRYWYYTAASPGTVSAASVATAIEGIIAAWLPDCQPAVVSHPTLSCDEVTSNDNFIERASTIPDGTLAGSELASYQCAGIRLLRSTKETRSGWKRIAAGDESTVGGNNWGPSFLSVLENFAAVLNDSFSISGNDFYPVIIRYTYDSGSGELNPPSQWIYNIIASVEVKPQVTTQNSRKVGRGS